jgi:hypothetical protein
MCPRTKEGSGKKKGKRKRGYKVSIREARKGPSEEAGELRVVIPTIEWPLHTSIMLQPFRESPHQEEHVHLEDKVDQKGPNERSI